MAISWVKDYSSASDGDVLSGSNLEDLQSRIETYTCHLSGTQTITGDKTFSGTTTITTVDINGGTLGGITIDGNWTAASQTCADLGAVTTCDINGGAIDGTIIGGSSAAAGSFTNITGTGTATFNDSGNAKCIFVDNDGAGYDLEIDNDGASGGGIYLHNQTAAGFKMQLVREDNYAAMMKLDGNYHGTNTGLYFTAENASGTDKSHQLYLDPDTNKLNTSADLHVVAELTATTKTFEIDHPIDPLNYKLFHGVVEAPKFGLMYDGKIKLVNGKTTLNLDQYYGMMAGTFEALVRADTRRIFLQNNDTWDLVKGSMNGAALTVVSKNSNSNAEIDFLVTGERIDPMAIASRRTDEQGNFILEEEKGNLAPNELEDIKKAKIIEEEIRFVERPKDVGEIIEEIDINLGNKKGYYSNPKAYGKEHPKIKRKIIRRLKLATRKK